MTLLVIIIILLLLLYYNILYVHVVHIHWGDIVEIWEFY